ncbi:bifunctional copper resistance protein CopD/cytochrome c oxidase assembly protein [Rhodococcus triatomae]|uniref:Putative copper resistance protein D n=1 Tax=Rhodococcus triatomae TaxID=300028 RepID=A0A1G8DV82_9NOCA|nr:cytochrome c oxidase assembly protein [Rhodococcus triatomae]QNG18337.1 bifunctional copper resistance protein CopD/cytochrome c oxidase assembly protein [Rhodococcus triatomae]QNG21993.1 bifunctional copper resistance protein CopD/cytochrome c oxidase assembly protein [Rhodococcus triatomae]SDH61624.1 putative copper resistance protein D [Rhodococcus triatomae]
MSTTDLAPSDTAPRAPARSGSAPIFVVSGLIAGMVAALVVGLSASEALVLLGIPDPGPITTYGLPAVRAVAEIAAVIAIGSLLLAAFFVPPQKSGVLDVDGYRAVRTASYAAVVWAACSAVLVPLTLSDTSGQPFSESVKPANLFPAISQVEMADAWRWTAIIAVVIAIWSRVVLRWWWTPIILVVAIGGLMPLAFSGHSSAGGSHDMATNSMIMHLVAASLWAGGLFALLAHARRKGAYTDVAARRFSAVATVCFVVMAFSGIVNSLVRLPLSDLFTTTYGRLVVAKVVALAVLGVFGWVQRRRSLPALAADPSSRRALIRFAGGEIIVFAATIGLAVGLGRTPPPPPASIPTVAEVELGYNLSGPPTFVRLATEWRFDLIFGTAALVFAAVYLIGVLTLRRRGDSWPVGRTIAWICGCAVLLIATSSGVGRYSPAVFSVHMGAHMALSMLGPVLLVLGAPVTLALRAFRPAGKDAPPGPREWILTALHSPYSRFVTHPLVAATLFVGGFYVLYLGGVFAATVDSHAAHLLMNLHFLLSGYLFYWVAIGIDPAPRQVQPVAKLGMVFGSLPFHAFFGVALMSTSVVMGEWFYRSLGLGWNDDLLGDQKLGGSIAWATGEIPLVVVMLALLVQWSRSDQRTATRVDRAAERDHDADLAAHNAMFAELARREREREAGR